MLLQPKDLYEKLEFDKVIQLLIHECLGDPGRQYFVDLTVSTDLIWIENRLKEAKELKLCLEKSDRFPFGDYEEISNDLKMLAIDGYVLSVESLQRINAILLIIRDIFKFFNPTRREIYPNLYTILRDTSYDEGLSKEITRVIDDEGKIRSDASPRLVEIRKAQLSKVRELDKVYRNIIGEFRQKGWLTDNAESFRNGRRVLSVPSEHKRKIRGIIHDESATGRTTYIEPEGAIDINNDIFDLEQEERQEIYRILKDLSATLRPYVPHLGQYQVLTIDFDVILAKAKLGLKMKAVMPQIKPNPQFDIKKGRHPLLYLKNRAVGKETVPMNLTLHAENRLLILSGPNAGGKSIAMKSVGLMQLMLQSGLLIPVNELSEMGLFENIFAQIGDAQSIEDDLSTYSSYLKNMQAFLEKADDKTLVLIDEFGSGTDPKIGGAIAEAILRGLNFKKTWGVITTHYGNLKMFAYKTQGIVNGCMNFDKDTLSPTYSMTVGRPGSSYAFEIASKVGLDVKTLEYAKKRIGENEQAVDELLVDLQREKQELTEKLSELTEKQKMLDKLIKTYDEQLKDVEFRRKKMKLDSKEILLQNTAKDNKEIESLMKQLRTEKNLDKAKEIATQVKAERQRVAEEVTELTEQVYYAPVATVKESRPIAVGDTVRMKAGSATGKIESINKNEVVVVMGEMRMKMKIRDVLLANEQLEIRDRKGIQMDIIEKSAAFEPKLDMRGLDMHNAQRVLESFVDQALLTGQRVLRIVHGKGDGVLRRVVKQKLKEYKGISNMYHPESHEGGDGVLIVELQ
jgi:DNA mismatch repair protein MutS2